MENQLLEVITESGVEKTTAQSLREAFEPFFTQANNWREKAQGLVITDETQTREMAMAREARLALKEIRVNANKTRKALKEDSLRYGKAVQGVYNVIEYLVVPIEKHLEEQEKFIERKEAERKAKLKESRELELRPYSEFLILGADYGEMSEEDFRKALNGAKLQFQAKIKAEKEAEEARIAKEKAEKEEQERIKKENEKLKAEAKEREKEAKLAEKQRAKEEADRIKKEQEAQKAQAEKERKEREAYAAKLEAERKEREKVEAELRAKNEKEEAEEKARKLAERKAKNASDKEKLILLAQAIQTLKFPEVQGEDSAKILVSVQELLYKTSKFILDNTEKLV